MLTGYVNHDIFVAEGNQVLLRVMLPQAPQARKMSVSVTH